MRARHPLGAGDEGGRIVEQIIHIFQVQTFCLGQERPEEERVDQIADDEDDVEFPADGRNGDGCHLADHRVEGEGGHGTPRHALGPHCGAEEFGGDGPRQGATGDEEDEVEDPGHDDEPPMRAGVVDRGGEDLDQSGVHDERDAHKNCPVYLHWASPNGIDDQNAHAGSEEGDNGVDCLKQERCACRYPNLGKDLG